MLEQHPTWYHKYTFYNIEAKSHSLAILDTIQVYSQVVIQTYKNNKFILEDLDDIQDELFKYQYTPTIIHLSIDGDVFKPSIMMTLMNVPYLVMNAILSSSYSAMVKWL